MPNSSNATATILKRKKCYCSKDKGISLSTRVEQHTCSNKHFLTIGPALPIQEINKNICLESKKKDALCCDSISLHSHPDGSFHLSHTQVEKERNSDRLSLDRRGLTVLPLIEEEPKLRLLSLQHNLIESLDGFYTKKFSFLVFLDVYDNHVEKMDSLDKLENLRVLLMGKNRIKKIEGLHRLTKIEVLDLHGNHIQQITGLSLLSSLKVLNLAGNKIRTIGISDLQGLRSLQELNLRRNKLKKLYGFGETTNLQKLLLSNNEIQSVGDMSSIAKSTNLREITIDDNPVSLTRDCISFLVSHLPRLTYLNTVHVTEHLKKTAIAWRRKKENSNSTCMDSTSDVSLNVKREEVISNARNNWELLRSQKKCFTAKTATNFKKCKRPNDFSLTPFIKQDLMNKTLNFPGKTNFIVSTSDRKVKFDHSSSQDTDNSQNTLSSNTSSNDFLKLPPILIPFINKEQENKSSILQEGNLLLSGSISSGGPNVDSSVCSLINSSSVSTSSDSLTFSESEYDIMSYDNSKKELHVTDHTDEKNISLYNIETASSTTVKKNNIDSSSNISVSSINISSITSAEDSVIKPKLVRNIKSAIISRTVSTKVHARAVTAKSKKQMSPSILPSGKDKEQGGDYLIEICGKHLNIYGQGALRYVDKQWNIAKANDVQTVNFNYSNFTGITAVLNKIKQRFPNAENFIFKETNIYCLGQINAFAEIQGFSSLYIAKEGNPIVEKDWEHYAIYRLSHWGLRILNGKKISEDDIKLANTEYQSLSELVLYILPDVLLHPLLMRLHLNINNDECNKNAKKWLMLADNALKSVVSKETLQWKKCAFNQEETMFRQNTEQYICHLLDDMCDIVNKIRLLDNQWPTILHEIVCNILLDFSQLDIYMKRKIQELEF